MKIEKLITLSILLLGLTTASFAQKMLDKPFDKWSKEEATKILNDSPWAQTYQSVKGTAAAEQIQSSREQTSQVIVGRTTDGRSSARVIPAPVVIRLNSALPIRQALVRLQQIGAGYDKMNEAARLKFNESAKGFLDCAACRNLYVVTITKFLNSGFGVDDGLFQIYKFEDLKGKVKLRNDKGEQRELVQFIAPTKAGESAVFFFPRLDAKGNPLITADNKDLEFVFANEFLETSNPYGWLLPLRFQFRTTKMLFDEKIVF